MSIQKRLERIIKWLGLPGLYSRLRVKSRLQIIPIEKIRRPKTPLSDMKGFEGKTVNCFPAARFYKLSLTDYDAAFDGYCDWIRDCLLKMKMKIWKIPQSQGGWAGGTVVNEIIKIHKEHGIELLDFEQADPVLIDNVIRRKVKHHFDTFNSIKENGYIVSLTSPVICRAENDTYIIVNGHHRIAAAWALGYKEIQVAVVT